METADKITELNKILKSLDKVLVMDDVMKNGVLQKDAQDELERNIKVLRKLIIYKKCAYKAEEYDKLCKQIKIAQEQQYISGYDEGDEE